MTKLQYFTFQTNLSFFKIKLIQISSGKILLYNLPIDCLHTARRTSVTRSPVRISIPPTNVLRQQCVFSISANDKIKRRSTYQCRKSTHTPRNPLQRYLVCCQTHAPIKRRLLRFLLCPTMADMWPSQFIQSARQITTEERERAPIKKELVRGRDHWHQDTMDLQLQMMSWTAAVTRRNAIVQGRFASAVCNYCYGD